MPDYDFTKLEIDKPPRRRHREDDDEPRRRDYGDVALFTLACLAGFAGISVYIGAKTVIHQIFAALCLVIASILFTGGMVYGAIKRD